MKKDIKVVGIISSARYDGNTCLSKGSCISNFPLSYSKIQGRQNEGGIFEPHPAGIDLSKGLIV